MKKTVKIIIAISIAVSISSAYSHVKSPLLPEGCGSCHVGHGVSGEPLLTESEENSCYLCHGSDENRTRMISEGKLSPLAKLKDIENEFRKMNRHPVVEGSGHSPIERLPLFTGAAPSHAECVDCHNPHQRFSQGKNLLHDVQGYTIAGQYIEKSVHEYQICLKCHTDFVGVDKSTRKISREFSLSARSQHPVTQGGSGISMPSLSRTMVQGQHMNCSDCHQSDDPDAPKGPHGSDHEHLLSGNYVTDVYADESPYAYQFCYSCHDRSSILSDESFPYHSTHIGGSLIHDIQGTSCYTCHASHGSYENAHLIEFNPKAVTGENNTGLIRYISKGTNSGECYLNCHGHNHNPARY